MNNQTVYSTLLDEAGRVISCNNSLRKQLGVDGTSQLIGKKFVDVFNAWEMDKLSQAVDACKVDPEIVVTIKVRRKSQQHDAGVFEWTISGETDTDGKCTVHLTGRRLTRTPDAKAKPKASIDSPAIYENFMKHSPLVGWVTDEKGILRYTNPTYLATYRVTENELGKSILDIFPAELAQAYLASDQIVLDSQHTLETTEKALLPTGEEQMLRVFKFPIEVDGKRMVAGWAFDITDQVRLQEELRKNVERFYYVKKATSDAVYDWDLQRKIIYRGMGFQTLFGYPDLRGSIRFSFKHVHPADLAAVKTTVFSSLRDANTTAWKIEYRFRDCNGTYKYVVDKAYIMRENGKAVRVVGAMQDISEQRALQGRLVKQEKANKRKVVESIIAAQEKERRNLSVELHDNVNQILSSCKLMLEAAQTNGQMASSLIAKTKRNLQTAITEIRKISHELNPSVLQDIGLVEAVTQMIDDINLSGKIRIAFIHEGCADRNCLAEEDRVAVFRIIQEKLHNILKHAQAQNAVIQLSLTNGNLKLIMNDDGVGFDVAKVKKGIGIRNIQHRVDYYGGTMRFKSAPGRGCRMEIHLPLRSAGKFRCINQQPLPAE